MGELIRTKLFIPGMEANTGETANDLPRFMTDLAATLQRVTGQIGAPLLSAL